jgi:glycosyltransferase involved in cell wall biosynthesis
MKKCDVIISVNNSPEYLSLCLYSLFKTTSSDVINKVYLINNSNDMFTSNSLINLNGKYNSIEVIDSFEKNINSLYNLGISKCEDKYVLLLDESCILSNKALDKMLDVLENDKTIALVTPVKSSDVSIYDGYSYQDMNNLFEKKLSNILLDTNSFSGAILISKELVTDINSLDSKNAKITLDTYVYSNKKCNKLTLKNNNKQDNILEVINSKISNEDKSVSIDNAIYMASIVKNAGGVHMVVDIVNYLIINGVSTNIIYDVYGEYNEIMLFKPLASDKLDNISIKNVIATIWSTTFKARKLADSKNAKLLYFVQGYECLFENGKVYGNVETSMKLVDDVFTISKYLCDEIKINYGLQSTIVQNGINYDLVHCNDGKKYKIETITFVLRNNIMKGDFIIMDIISKIEKNYSGLTLNVVYMNDDIAFPHVEKNILNKIRGPIQRNDIVKLLLDSDIYIDASLNEGFGLTALEAMTAGNVVISSNSFGVNEYITNNENGYIIDSVNNSSKYIEKLDILLNDINLYIKMRNKSLERSIEFDIDKMIPKYIEFFNRKRDKREISLTKEEKELVERLSNISTKGKSRVYGVSKMIPKSVKKKMKKIVTTLYDSYEH